MPVPEAPVHEDCDTPPRERKIGLSWELAVMAAPASLAARVERATEGQLRLGVARADPRHHPAAGFLREEICHGASVPDVAETCRPARASRPSRYGETPTPAG